MSRPGRLIGRWATDQVLIRLDDGRAFEAPAPEQVGDFEVGDAITAYFDRSGAFVGWRLERSGAGVDLRGWASAREREPDEMP